MKTTFTFKDRIIPKEDPVEWKMPDPVLRTEFGKVEYLRQKTVDDFRQYNQTSFGKQELLKKPSQ